MTDLREVATPALQADGNDANDGTAQNQYADQPLTRLDHSPPHRQEQHEPDHCGCARPPPTLPEASSHEPQTDREQAGEDTEHHMAGGAQTGTLGRHEGEGDRQGCTRKGLQPDDRRCEQSRHTGVR